jgi:hypothetical protein
MKEHQWDDNGKDLHIGMFVGVSPPHTHHVGEKPQQHESVRTALVLEKDVDESRAVTDIDGHEQVRLGLNVLSIDERGLDDLQALHVQE